MFLPRLKLNLLSNAIFYLSGVLLFYMSGTSAVGMSNVIGQISIHGATKEENGNY